MLKIEAKWLDLRYLDELATRNTVIHRRNPGVKLFVTIVFIITVTSFSKYEISGLLPFFLFPFLSISLAKLPQALIFRRLLIVAPFILFIGIFNPFFDHTPIVKIHSIVITGGWISFFSITLRLLLTVTAALVLIATTGIDAIGWALQRMGVPKIVVVQLLFMYRYLHVLAEEFIRCVTAYSLRSFHGTGIRPRAWGSLLGQLLIRSVDRAGRIYRSMLCRGFDGEVRRLRTHTLAAADGMYVVFWLLFFLIARLWNIPGFLGTLLMGV